VSLAEALGADFEKLRERDLAPVEVAILDTGIDATHPMLSGRVAEAHAVAQAAPGYALVETPVPACNDLFGHGTGVASIVAEIAPNARIIDLRVVEPEGIGTGEGLLAGFGFAIQRGFRVVNLSLACNRRFLRPVMELCELAYWRDQIVVAARRNAPLHDHGIPAELVSCIGVESEPFPSPFHFRFHPRRPIEASARGDEVIVAAPDGKYTLQSGTSYAAPTLAALCALLLGAYPELTPFEVRSVIKARGIDR
jgi:subtilisin family serine protease